MLIVNDEHVGIDEVCFIALQRQCKSGEHLGMGNVVGADECTIFSSRQPESTVVVLSGAKIRDARFKDNASSGFVVAFMGGSFQRIGLMMEAGTKRGFLSTDSSDSSWK